MTVASELRSEAVQADAPPTAVWLVVLVLAGYPIAWAVGLGPAVFPLAALLMALWLLNHRPLRIPPGTILLAAFLVVVAASIIEVDSVGRMGLWTLRAGWYGSAFVTWLFLARQTSVRARCWIVYGLVATWAMAIVGGYLALVIPELSWSSPVSSVLPGVIGGDPYVRDLIEPRVAEIQTFYPDIRLYRPAAPYPYTNAWGSNVALLTPFVFAALQESRLRIPRWLLAGALILAVVPFYSSLNRGAWLTLGIGMLYGVMRTAAITRRLLPVVLLIGLGIAAVGVAVASGQLGEVNDRLDTRTTDSNETRAGLYIETLQRSVDSPLLGHGAPRASTSNPSGPPLGTHGQLWAILFAHGYIAAGLYVAFFVGAFLRARAGDPVPLWAKASLAIGLLQLPIYGHLPHQLFIMIVAAAVAAWPANALAEPRELSAAGSQR